MKRRMHILAIVVLAAIAGCQKQGSHDVPEIPEEARQMTVRVKSSESEPKFTFLFWEKDHFDNGLQNATAPYFVATPTGEPGSYEEIADRPGETDYNTGRAYPDNYGIVMCTGYGPYAEIEPSDEKHSILEVKYPGSTDVLVARNFLEGSSLYPFQGNLEFQHPQIQLTIRAKLADGMAKYIKGVSFSVGGENLLSALKWDGTQKQYMPSGRHNADWKSETNSEYRNKSDNKLLGTVLVVPKESDQNLLMTSIDLNIFGLIANTEAEAGTDFKMEVTADLTNAQGGGLTLGDSYEILLYFDEDQIEITASKVPWEEGGNILVPIHPIPDV
jgi:hypothetical protein